ncbi:unnamed protein product, partial [Rotaria sp. Silwood2]
MPSQTQSTTVINTDEIARKLEAVYGIKSESIYISTIVISNCEAMTDGLHRRQLQWNERE